jgi:hypothetical protein|tara:strand:+ start:619 stop:837 length:219 start_codon:yes stop_codon:yes gene_type:complete
MALQLAYCDYIADTIQILLRREIGDNDTVLEAAGNVKMDLHPEEGYFMSTKKTIEVEDINGKVYLVTVEEKV